MAQCDGACVRSRALVDTTAMRSLHEQAEAQHCQLRVQIATDDRAVGTHMPEDISHYARRWRSGARFFCVIVLLRLPRTHLQGLLRLTTLASAGDLVRASTDWMWGRVPFWGGYMMRSFAPCRYLQRMAVAAVRRHHAHACTSRASKHTSRDYIMSLVCLQARSSNVS